MNVIKTELPNLCFVGDIHGDFTGIAGTMKFSGLTDVAYVFCGDCGFGFESEEYYNQAFNKVGKTANKMNAECYFVRGNHESKEYYDYGLIKRKRFKTVKDYTVIQTPEHNILCIGGATSIDRVWRLEGNAQYVKEYMKYHPVSEEEAVRKAKKCYWMDEPPVYDENALNELKENGIEIDIVATHTCPSFAQPLHKKGLENWMKYDPMLENDLNYERLVMDNVYNKLIEDGHPLQKWIYGHFHYHNSEFIGDVNFVMLDMSRNGKMDVLQIHSKTEENK